MIVVIYMDDPYHLNCQQEFLMRVSQEEKAKSRERILAAASEILRRDGLAQTGVSDVMSAAQMTHGGFYRHFASREDLLSQALLRSFSEFEAMARARKGCSVSSRRICPPSTERTSDMAARPPLWVRSWPELLLS
jgi:AcrR family transcriptional regulator